MPIVLNPQQSAIALASGSSEIKYLLAREGVSADIQAVFFHVGATTLAKFAVLMRDENDVRKVMKDELGIDDQAGLSEEYWQLSRRRTWEHLRLDHIVGPGLDRFVQWNELPLLKALSGVREFGLLQSDFGTHLLKPTRILLKGNPAELFFSRSTCFRSAG